AALVALGRNHWALFFHRAGRCFGCCHHFTFDADDLLSTVGRIAADGNVLVDRTHTLRVVLHGDGGLLAGHDRLGITLRHGATARTFAAGEDQGRITDV